MENSIKLEMDEFALNKVVTELRKKENLTKTDFAKKYGIDRPYLSRVESEKHYISWKKFIEIYRQAKKMRVCENG
jgi:transcriptional regulator with XRE-family HTH domain